MNISPGSSSDLPPVTPPDLDIPWLAAKRATISNHGDLAAFADGVRSYVSETTERSGHTVATAVWWSLGALVAGLVIFIVGGFVLEAGQALMDGMNDG